MLNLRPSLLSLLVILSFLSRFNSSSAKADQLIYRDWAGLKVGAEVYFLSDLAQIFSKARHFTCFFPNSYIFRQTGLDYYLKLADQAPLTQDKTMELLRKDAQTRSKGLFLALASLIKVFQFVEEQKVIQWRGMMEQKKSPCLPPSPDQAHFFKGEKFFRDRFKAKAFWVTDSEVAGRALKNPLVPKSVLAERIKKEKIDNAMELFGQSLFGRKEHRILINPVGEKGEVRP